MERGLTKQQIITELTRSPHGALAEYVPVGQPATRQEPEFMAHLIAWNRRNGQIRDAKVGLPVVYLSQPQAAAFLDNALAHLAMLDPRNLVRALRFAREIRTPGAGGALRRMVEKYLRLREERVGWWDAASLQHRQSMKTLYAMFHIDTGERARAVLFGQVGSKRSGREVRPLPTPAGSVFAVVRELKQLTPGAVARLIVQHKISPLITMSVLGPRMKEPAILQAIIETMSPSELRNYSDLLQKAGVMNDPALRGAYTQALQRVAESGTDVLKTTVAAEQVEDPVLAERLRGAQERQISKAAGIDGNWLMICDRSPSMKEAIDVSVQLAAVLARFVKGNVHMVFVDGDFHRYVNATGLALDAIKAKVGPMTAGGSGTTLGAGITYALEKRFDVDAIAVVSDGADNGLPPFVKSYERLNTTLGKTLPVYLYWLKCHMPNLGTNNPDSMAAGLRRGGHDLQVFDLRAGFDYYSLPNIVQTMRTQRHGLVEEIMDTPLLRLDDVWKQAA